MENYTYLCTAMITYNISFILEHRREEELYGWLGEAVRMSALPADRTNVVKVVAVPGDPDFVKQALSVSLQVRFDSLSEASKWGRESAPALLESYSRRFGAMAQHFSTVLKDIDIADD